MEEMAGLGHCPDRRDGGDGSIHNGKRHLERSQRHKLISIKPPAQRERLAILHYLIYKKDHLKNLRFTLSMVLLSLFRSFIELLSSMCNSSTELAVIPYSSCLSAALITLLK